MPANMKSSISDAINVIASSLSAMVLAEQWGINFADIVGVKLDSTGNAALVRFTPEIYKTIKNKSIPGLLIWEEKNYSLTFFPAIFLKEFPTSTALQPFPYYAAILDTGNYQNSLEELPSVDLIERCKYSNNANFQHFISSLQALQRELASRMLKPLAHKCVTKWDNGLSIEYQCEIYARQLYGAKLLGIWHHYLLLNGERNKPEDFLAWLQTQSADVLIKFGIKNLTEVPKVWYMKPEERQAWKLNFKAGNILENDQLPVPQKKDEALEIIYVFGKADFFGGVKSRGVINHSSFFAGEKVDGAGRLKLKSSNKEDGSLQWMIDRIDNNSGHIKPDDEMSLKTIMKLKAIGLDLTSINIALLNSKV